MTGRCLRACLCLALLLLLGGIGFGGPVRAAETDCPAHDPSRIVRGRDGIYWLYGTGRGIRQFSSPDRLHWTERGPVFPHPPAWVAAAVPANTKNYAWAPDVIASGGKYYLYYCYSSFGSKTSAIGVAVSTTLSPDSWADMGVVLQSGPDTSYNAIDPCPLQDASGKLWLSFGSFFSGIELAALDPAAGGRLPGGAVREIAARPRTPGNPIEASYLTFHAGFYYLFVNFDRCCAGAKSTYNIRVGRSASVSGPYLDKAGKDLQEGGGSVFLASVPDDGSGRPWDDRIGFGHVGILSGADGDWLTTHAEWVRDRQGRTTVILQKLLWDEGSWPRAVLDPGPWRIVSAQPTHDDLRPGTPLWTLSDRGGGVYRIASVPGGKPLIVDGAALWAIRQNADGTYTLGPGTAAGKPQALDAAAPVSLRADLGTEAQKWSFRAP